MRTQHRSLFMKRRSAAPVVAAAALLSAVALLSGCAADSGSASPTGTADSANFPDKPATGSTVKIGVAWAEGGSISSNPELGFAAQAAADYINNNDGGIAGHKIELVTCKLLETVPSAQDCANQMVQADVAAFVATGSGVSDSMVPIIVGAGIPYITAAAGGQAELATPGVYSWTGGLSSFMPGIARFAKAQSWKNVSAVVIDSPNPLDGIKTISPPAFQAAGVGLNIVPLTYGLPDATSQVDIALKDEPEGVAVITDVASCTTVMQAMQTAGSDAAPLFSGSCLQPSVVNALGSYLDGGYVVTSGDIYTNDPESVLYRDVMAKYAADSPTIGGTAIYAYQGVLGLARVLDSTLQGDPTPANINTAIKAAKDVPLPAGGGLTITCDGTAIPGYPSACSSGVLVGQVSGDGTTVASVKVY